MQAVISGFAFLGTKAKSADKQVDLKGRPSGLWSWITHPIAGGKQDDDKPWHVVAAHLIILLPVVDEAEVHMECEVLH